MALQTRLSSPLVISDKIYLVRYVDFSFVATRVTVLVGGITEMFIIVI